MEKKVKTITPKFLKKPSKKPVNTQEKRSFDMRPNLSKLYLYVTIVNAGVAKNIIKLFETIGCSAQFVNVGTGTANEQVLKTLNITDNKKEIVFSFVRETYLPDVEREVSAFFMASKRNRGVGFAIPLTTLMGVRVYKFLTQTL